MKEHLLAILASVALCAGGVYYWSYRVERNKAAAFQELGECIKKHARDPRHWVPSLVGIALLEQSLEVVQGTCKPELQNALKREQFLGDRHLFAPGKLDQLQLSPAELGELKQRGIDLSSLEQPGTVLFFDDMLSEKVFAPRINAHCRASHDSEGYVVQNVDASGACELPILRGGRFDERVKIDIWVKLRSGASNRGYGLLFAQQPADSAQPFAFIVDTLGSFQLSQYTDGWHNFVWNPDSNIRRGYNVWNRLTVEIRGQSIELFVNGQPVGSAPGHEGLKGPVGCYLGAPGMVAVFRNITVSQL
jgi:hypothetical protein